jgi:hypothetical protein
MLLPALGSSASTVASLSRAFAREIENLPTIYLRSVASMGVTASCRVSSDSACREFYKIKVGDDINALPSPESPDFKARYKRVSRVRFGFNFPALLSLKGSGSNRS